MPTLPCPHCSHLMEVATSRAGAEIQCPACHNTVSVPKLGQLRQLANADDQPRVTTATSGLPLGRRLLFAALLAAAAVALAIAVFGFIRYAALKPPQTTAGHIADVEQAYAEAPPAQLVREWQQMEKFHPEIAAPYPYKLIANEKAAWLRQGLIGLAVAVLSALMAALLVLLRPRPAVHR